MCPRPVLREAEGFAARLFPGNWARDNCFVVNILTAKSFVERELAEPARQVIAFAARYGLQGGGVPHLNTELSYGTRHAIITSTMYLPPHFEESRPEVLQEVMREYPLGTLVTLTSAGLTANHIPFEYDPQPAPLGTLRSHVARGNAVWKDFDKKTPALVIFGGPRAYISPNWYEAKREHGKVVPTYNYVVVHAYGPMRVIEDAQWLHGLVSRLTEKFESARPQPWAVSDAPLDYIGKQLGAIVGIEIPVRRLIGKAKASQNRSADDQAGVIRGLREDDPHDPMADWMDRPDGKS